MNIYKGKEPCQGCGRPGTEMYRNTKDCLCPDCQAAIEIGRTIIKEKDLKRKHYQLEDLKMAQITWYVIPIGEIETALIKLLESFSQFDKRYAPYNQEHFGRFEPLTGSHKIVLPEITYNAAKELTEKIISFCWTLRKKEDNYKKELEEQLNNERNCIYNDGLAHGKKLLSQLNEGKITLEEFETTIIKKY